MLHTMSAGPDRWRREASNSSAVSGSGLYLVTASTALWPLYGCQLHAVNGGRYCWVCTNCLLFIYYYCRILLEMEGVVTYWSFWYSSLSSTPPSFGESYVSYFKPFGNVLFVFTLHTHPYVEVRCLRNNN